MAKDFNNITEQVDAFRRKYYSLQLLNGSLWTSGILLALLLSLFSIEYFFYLPVAWKTLLFYLFLGFGLFITYKKIVSPILSYLNIRAGLSRAEAAKMIGSRLALDDELTNALQLMSKLNDEGKDSSLIEASLESRVRHFGNYSFPKAIPWSESLRFVKYLALPLLLIFLMLAAAPRLLLDGGVRFVDYSQSYLPEAPFQFVLDVENLQCVQNEDFLLKLKTEGEYAPDQVFVRFGEAEYLMRSERPGSYLFTIKNARENIEFSFSSGRFSSKKYLLNVLPDPRLKSMRIQLNYPSYLGLEDEEIQNQGNLSIPEGTEISWLLQTENIDWLSLSLPDSVFLKENAESGRASFDFTARSSGEYRIDLKNSQESLNKRLSYSLDVVEDRRPEIRMDRLGDSLSLKEIYFSGLISDDYGLQQLKFYAQLDGSPGFLKEEGILINRQLPNQPVYHYFNLEEHNIRAGQSIRMWFVVWDHDGVNGSKSSKSAVIRLEAPSLDELKKAERASKDEMEASMKDKIEDLQKFQKEIKELERRLIDKKELNWQDKKALQDLMQKQKDLQDSMEKLQKQNKQLNETRNQLTEEDERLLEKQKKIEDLFENLMTDEMKELFEEMEKMMEKLNKDQVQEKLSEMKMNNEEMEKELDRTLELFKQFEFEKALQDGIDKLDELKKEQEKLSDEKEENADKQDELNEKFEEFAEDMKDLKEKNEALEKPNEMGNPEEKSKEVLDEMEKSSEDMKSGNKKQGKQGQKSAAEQMQEMQDQMQSMMNEMGEEQAAEDLEALRRLLENLIQLSFDQEGIIDQLDGISGKDPRFVELAQEQKKLKDDSQVVADSLYALSKRVVALEATINKEMNEINKRVESAISLLSDRRSREAQKEQQFAMTGMNNLALILDESIQNAQMQSAQKQFGSGKCSKPGSSPSAGSLKKMQEALNKQMEALKKQMEGEKKGPTPGGKKPGETGQGGTGSSGQHSEQLSKLAAKQSAIRNELRRLKESMRDGQGKGEMQKLEKMMEDTERDLISRQLSLETIKRQEEILTRLLESERSERERDFEEERQAREGKKNEKRNLFDLDEYIKLKEKENELYRTIPPKLNPYYKNKVSEYLNK